MKTSTPVTTKTPPEKVSKERVIEAVIKANKGAKRFQAFQLDPKSIKVFPYDRASQHHIIRGRVMKVWEAGEWRGNRMTSVVGRVEDMTIRHAETEQMPYYADLLKDSGIQTDHVRMKAFNLPDGFYVEFLFLGLEKTEWVKKDKKLERVAHIEEYIRRNKKPPIEWQGIKHVDGEEADFIRMDWQYRRTRGAKSSTKTTVLVYAKERGGTIALTPKQLVNRWLPDEEWLSQQR